jgi:hypothetical protein
MTDTIRVWTRSELEEAAAIRPEGATMLKVSASPAFLLALVEFMEQKGERIEVLSAYGDPNACELRFFRRDVA